MNIVQMKNKISRRIERYCNEIENGDNITLVTYAYERAYGMLLITSELDILNITEFKELALRLNLTYSDKMIDLTSR